MDTLLQTEYAWAAGFIDGEGTITLKRYKSHYTVRKIHYQPFVCLGQADFMGHYDAVRHLQKLFGGSVSEYKNKPPRRKTLQWSIVSRQAVECLIKIRSYLKVKNHHADLLIGYYDGAGKRGRVYRLSDEELGKREKIWSEMRAINQKGKLHLQRLSEVTPKGDAIV